MDTITHLALGACIGEVLATRSIGKKALVIGAVAQSIPDADFICSLWMEPSANVLAHRGFTHSFLFAVLLVPLLAWLAQRWWKKGTFKFWILFFGIQLLVHIGIDAFNAYGTGWFEPFSHARISFHTLFVADPFFSVPLGIAALVLVVLRTSDYHTRMYWAMGSIVLSVLYLGYGLINKMQIDAAVKSSLHHQGIEHQQYFTTPTPFNTWLWFIVATNASGNFVAHRSVWDDEEKIEFTFFPRQDSLLARAGDAQEVNRLKRFSQGYYTVAMEGDTLLFNDLRFGQMIGWENPKAGFVFHYYLDPPLDNKLVLQRGRFQGWDGATAKSFLKRATGRPLR